MSSSYELPKPRGFRFEVSTRANRAQCWEIFTDWKRYNEFVNGYGEMIWTGIPWAVGSRLQIELLRPVSVKINHVITGCDPGRKIGWLDHGLGITIEQWVLFEEEYEGGTKIITSGEFVGAESMMVIKGMLIEKLVKYFLETWYVNFANACDRAADVVRQSAAKSDQLGLNQ